jgi:hypothetical protein
MEEALRWNRTFQIAKNIYYTVCWLPLLLFIAVGASPGVQLHPYEGVIDAFLAAFPIAGACLIVWGLRVKSAIRWLPLAMLPGCLILYWFVSATNYIHFLQGVEHLDSGASEELTVRRAATDSLVVIKPFASITELEGVHWPQTNNVPDSSVAFTTPCDCQINIDEGHSCRIWVVGGMLGQEQGKLRYSRLYLTAHPVTLDEGLKMIGNLAEKCGVSKTAPYQEYLAKMNSKRPPPTAGSVRCCNIPINQEVLVSLQLLASVREDGWYVQLLIDKNF